MGRPTTHGMGKTRFYNTWCNILKRCNNIKVDSYYLYGGKGIKCKWDSFEDFKKDMYHSYIEHEKKYGTKNTTIDRIKNNENYCKENCKWSTAKEQANNTSRNRYIEYKGVTRTLTEWSELLGIKTSTLRMRISNYKWSIEKAFTT